jgi:prefoldin subunit 5
MSNSGEILRTRLAELEKESQAIKQAAEKTQAEIEKIKAEIAKREAKKSATQK